MERFSDRETKDLEERLVKTAIDLIISVAAAIGVTVFVAWLVLG